MSSLETEALSFKAYREWIDTDAGLDLAEQLGVDLPRTPHAFTSAFGKWSAAVKSIGILPGRTVNGQLVAAPAIELATAYTESAIVRALQRLAERWSENNSEAGSDQRFFSEYDYRAQAELDRAEAEARGREFPRAVTCRNRAPVPFLAARAVRCGLISERELRWREQADAVTTVECECWLEQAVMKHGCKCGLAKFDHAFRATLLDSGDELPMRIPTASTIKKHVMGRG